MVMTQPRHAFFLRLHGPTKATTLGVGSLLLASAAYFSFESGHIRFQEVLIMLFLFMTVPVSAHLLAKAALHLGAPSRPAAAQESGRRRLERRRMGFAKPSEARPGAARTRGAEHRAP
jgi:monovalent cation/proton antiporter MnhG/PhaG subunit